MIDLHCHILPGIDDGASDFSQSLEMARIAANDGIQKIVATPHIKDVLHAPETICNLVDELNERIRKAGIDLEILAGGDVSVLVHTSRMLPYTIHGSKYILIEFPHHHLPKNSAEILFNLEIQGMLPIITHPERNLSIIKKPQLLLDLLNGNAMVQLTAGSLTGQFGRDAQACAVYLLQQGAVHILATDAHSPKHRPPVLSAGLRAAEKIIGSSSARKLVLDNPLAVLQDTAICVIS